MSLQKTSKLLSYFKVSEKKIWIELHSKVPPRAPYLLNKVTSSLFYCS